MDAASYINTLDALALTNTPPAPPRFAMVDLAMNPGFLKSLYGAMTRQASINWFSLFTDTRWQPEWVHGPVLVNLTDAPAFAEALTTNMAATPCGVLIHSHASSTELFQRCQRWLLSTAETDESLLRFYEPRMLTPLMAVLHEAQRAQLVAPGECWAWHNGHQWQQYRSADHESQPTDPVPRVTDNQLEQMPGYRLAQRAQRYAERYRDHLTAHKDARTWVLARLVQAREAHFTTVAHQERWLRLAMENGADFYQQAPFQSALAQPSLTPADKLAAMETPSEPTHVPL